MFWRVTCPLRNGVGVYVLPRAISTFNATWMVEQAFTTLPANFVSTRNPFSVLRVSSSQDSLHGNGNVYTTLQYRGRPRRGFETWPNIIVSDLDLVRPPEINLYVKHGAGTVHQTPHNFCITGGDKLLVRNFITATIAPHLVII